MNKIPDLSTMGVELVHMEKQETQSTTNDVDPASVDSVVMRSEHDVTFEQAIFEWYHGRGRELYAAPNHPEFQARIDEHQKMFAAMLTIKHAMLPAERRKQVLEAIVASFCDDD